MRIPVVVLSCITNSMRLCGRETAGINVQGYVQLIGQGKYREAVQLILERLPLPGTPGRACPHPCEARCLRSEADAHVAIRALKRFAADRVDLASLPLQELLDGLHLLRFRWDCGVKSGNRLYYRIRSPS